MLKKVKDSTIDLKLLTKIMSENSAKIFGIKNKGILKECYDGDLTIIDLDDESEIIEEDIITKAAWSPYIGFKRGGRVLTTILRGNIVYEYDSDLNEDIFYSGFGREVSYY